jgi:hypothetical protein
MNIIHECNVQCHAMDVKTADLIGLEDVGKWMPFVFHMSIVDAAKLSSDDEDSISYNCTTVLTNTGDSYIIDTNYKEFFKKFIKYNTVDVNEKGDDSILDL